MEWKESSVRGSGGKRRFSTPAVFCSEEPQTSVVSRAPWSNAAALACLSLTALPIAPQCSDLPLPSPAAGSVPHHQSGSGVSTNSCCACALPPAMHSLLPSPFSCSSLSSFFPAHLAPHRCATLSSGDPTIPRRRRRSLVMRTGSWENAIRLSSLASLASSLPSFSSAENAFAAGAKEDLKIGGGGMAERDAGGGPPLVRNLMAGNARLRKDVADFFQGLPSEFRGLPRQSFGRAAKRKDSESFGVAAGAGIEKTAVKIVDGKKKAIQTSQHLLAGAVAAMVSRTIVAPLERLKLEYLVRGAKGSVIKTVQTILLNEGVRGFWKGNGVNVLRTAPFKAVNFFAFDVYRKQLLKWGERTEVTNVERLAAGAAAGVTATMLCFPLDTIRTVMVAPGGEALGGMIGCFQNLIRTEGFFALYKGLPAAVVSMAPSGAVFYGVYDILKVAYLSSPEGIEMVKERRKRAQERPEEISSQLELGPFRTLLFGALAGACAETVTYPLEVVRRAQQMQHLANKLGMLGTIQSLLSKGGVGALYAGLLPSTLQVLPSAALSYFVYESAKIAFKIP